MTRLKADLHIHNKYDILDRAYGTNGLVSPYKIIDLAVENGYHVLSFTHHGVLYHDPNVIDYAKDKGIILIPGIEAFINRKHVLLYNFRQKIVIDSFTKLEKFKGEENLVIAPHPFYPWKCCLKKDVFKYMDCFDALEYSHFYTNLLNPNRKTLDFCYTFDKTIVGFSDTHIKEQFGTTYSLIDVDEVSVEGIIDAIKKGRVEVVSIPLNMKRFVKICLWMAGRMNYISGKEMRKNILSIESYETSHSEIIDSSNLL